MNQDSFAYLQTLMWHKKVNLLGECISLPELKLPLTGQHKQQNLLSHCSKGWKSEIKVLAGFIPSGSSEGFVIQSPSHVQPFATPWMAAHQASLSFTISHTSRSSSRWCHPTISSSVVLFSSHLQTFPAPGSFQMSQFVASGGQNLGVSAATSVLPMNTQDWLPLGWTGWISLQSKGLSRVFSNTTVQKHQFFGAQLSL